MTSSPDTPMPARHDRFTRSAPTATTWTDLDCADPRRSARRRAAATQTRRRAAILAGVLGLVVLPGLAGAAWTATEASGQGAARALDMPIAAAPTVQVQGRNVTVSWPTARLADAAATPVGGYEVRRYNVTTGGIQTVTNGCAGIVTATTCTERSVPSGNWRYAVVTRLAAWSGAEGPSTGATVGAPTLALSATSVDNAGQAATSATTATATGLFEGEVVTFTLGSANGTTLGTAAADATGTAQATLTIPYGTATGATSVVATGSQGSSTSAALQVTAAARTLVVTASTANPTAGSTVTVTVQALVNGVADTAVSGVRTVSVTGLAGALNGSATATVPTSATFGANGVATFSVVPVRGGTPTMTVSLAGTGHSGTASLTVRQGTVASLTFVGSPCPTAPIGKGGIWDSAVRASDSYGNLSNPASAISVALARSGDGSLSTTTATIAAGSSPATSSSFRATLSAGNNRQMTVTATAGGQTVSCVLTSN